MIRFVFDTNTIVSALLFGNSVPRQAFDRALDSGTILISDSLVMELSRVLGRARFDRYVSLEERNEFLVSLIRDSDLIEVTEPPIRRGAKNESYGVRWSVNHLVRELWASG